MGRIHHGCHGGRTGVNSVMVIAVPGSGVVIIAVADDSRWTLALEKVHDLIAHVAGRSIPIPEIVLGQTPWGAPRIVLVILAASRSVARPYPVGRKSVVVVPIGKLRVQALAAHGIPIVVAGKGSETLHVSGTHVARVGFLITPAPGVPGFQAAGVRFILKNAPNICVGRRVKTVSRPTLMSSQKAYGDVEVAVRSGVHLDVSRTRHFPVHESVTVRARLHEVPKFVD
jgi:hypothetical protein